MKGNYHFMFYLLISIEYLATFHFIMGAILWQQGIISEV